MPCQPVTGFAKDMVVSHTTYEKRNMRQESKNKERSCEFYILREMKSYVSF